MRGLPELQIGQESVFFGSAALEIVCEIGRELELALYTYVLTMLGSKCLFHLDLQSFPAWGLNRPGSTGFMPN